MVLPFFFFSPGKDSLSCAFLFSFLFPLRYQSSNRPLHARYFLFFFFFCFFGSQRKGGDLIFSFFPKDQPFRSRFFSLFSLCQGWLHCRAMSKGVFFLFSSTPNEETHVWCFISSFFLFHSARAKETSRSLFPQCHALLSLPPLPSLFLVRLAREEMMEPLISQTFARR